MPTYRSKKSSVPFHSNYWENCDYDKGYDTYYRFNKEQYYEGKFFRDSIHGQGTYKWGDVAVYEGSFYSNSKEGYACLSLPDNSYFEGLFIRNEPFGPGILTYSNGRQDAGFWVGRKLVRLSRAVDFIIPRLAPTSAAKLKLLQFRRLIPLDETGWEVSIDFLKKCGYPFQHFYSPYSSLIYDPRSIFFDKPAFEKTYFLNIKDVLMEFSESQKSWESVTKAIENKEGNKIRSREPCLQTVSSIDDKTQDSPDICDRESSEGEVEMGILGYFTKFGTIEELQKNAEEEEEYISGALSENLSVGGEAEGNTNSRPLNIVSWNRSELCTEMLKQIFRYRAFEENLTFDLAQLMLGVRTAFRRTGLKEKQCLQFLKMCSLGPPHVLQDFLCSHEISEELMDARGNNGVMFAAAADQHEIIDILLDYGADVNTFNDENLTPLNLCLLRRLAYSRGISNWETAFLPREIDVPREYQEPQVLEAQVSISSLDRIFGDGMSLNDSKSRISDSRLSPILLQTVSEPSETNGLPCHRSLEDSRDMCDLSQITILNLTRSPGSHVLVRSPQDDETRKHFPKRSSSIIGVRDLKEVSQHWGSNEETPRINANIVPKSNKRDEFLRSIIKSKKDRYLFEFTFEKKPPVLAVESKKIEIPKRHSKQGSKLFKADSEAEEEEEEEEENYKVVEDLVDFELSKKIAEIDKTIQKLLRRGANPNISEVPKPAIHLGIYTNDLNTVYNLLLYGANPNSQLYANEGLLTPLHVVVLQPSSREQVDICELLLNFRADPDKRTHPEFSICEDEKDFLDPQQGRTPLQLLCMRPDLEYADPDDNLIKIGLLLASECDRKSFYNGHSHLTLAMMFGNMKLLKALLESGLFDTNEVLEKDRGTALHVLVSTELQKKTTYENSVAMCDRLIEAGANPLKKFQKPESLRGNCVDYGYREIEAERELRKASATLKKDAKKTEKSGKQRILFRDSLEDHEKIVEYLGNIAAGMAEKKKPKRKRGDLSQGSLSEDLKTGEGVLGKTDEYAGETGKGRRRDSGGGEGKTKQKGKDSDDSKDGKAGKKGDKEPGQGKKGDNELERGDKGDNELEKGKKGDNELGKGKKGDKELEKGDKGDNELEKGKKGDNELGKGKKGDKELEKGDKGDKEPGKGKKGDGETQKSKKGRADGEEGIADEAESERGKKRKGEGKTEAGDLEKGKKKKGDDEEGEKRGKKAKTGLEAGKEKEDSKKGKHVGEDSRKEKEGKQDPRKGKDGKQDPSKGTKQSENDSRKDHIKLKDKDSNLLKLSKSSSKHPSTRQLGARSETFPEKLRQNLLQIYGNCFNIDINEFLVPYVVLRDGDLYYRFHGKAPARKEQYSLI